MKKQNLALIFLLFLTACATAVHYSGKRSPSSVVETPTGLSPHEMADFEHLSEGSDIYPYEWLLALKTVHLKDKKGKFTVPFYTGLTERFGVLPATYLESSAPNHPKYLVPYVGFTASWSDQRGEQADAYLEEASIKSRTFPNQRKSIKMVGVNCAFCHSGAIQSQKGSYFIEGAPHMANIRGLFEDLALSTIAMLAQKDVLIQFLREMGVENPEIEGKKISNLFLVEFGRETGNKKLRKYLEKVDLNNVDFITEISSKVTFTKAQRGNRTRFYEGKKAISMGLEKLLRVTYGFKDTDDIGELKKRMEFLGTLMVGTAPDTAETTSGWDRTDAFGRIGNLVLRGQHPIDYTSPVSLPWIWGIKYMAMLHYTANTNSVLLRNIGQSLGLGAIVLDDQTHSSTVNVFNLDRIERLADKIQVPWWEKMFANDPSMPINSEVIGRGKILFDSKCAKCHVATSRVGPTAELIDYNVLPLSVIKTDPMAAINCAKDVDGVPFKDSILPMVEKLRDAYYTEMKTSDKDRASYAWADLRGQEFFRDTLNGYTVADQRHDNSAYGVIEKGAGYKARDLSGVWATAPYLHNGSVPTIRDLLSPAGERPKVFNVRSTKYDPYNLGFENRRVDLRTGKTPPCGTDEESCYDTSIKGNSNQGHDGPEFGIYDLTNDDKTALIEYLKVLKPEDNYSWNY
jgi:hypothetical protein